MQKLFISGAVGKDAVLRRTQSGDAILGFSLAVDNGKDASGNKRPATWFDCSIWGKRAESLEQHIVKGSKLSIIGRPTAREHDGKVYLGCSVDDLTFMGGGSDRRDDDDRGSSGSGYGAGGRPGANDMDDEIPFAPSVL